MREQQAQRKQKPAREADLDEAGKYLICTREGCRARLARIVENHFEFDRGWAPDMQGTWHLTRHSERRAKNDLGQKVRRPFKTVYVDVGYDILGIDPSDPLRQKEDARRAAGLTTESSPGLERVAMLDDSIPLDGVYARCPNPNCGRKHYLSLYPYEPHPDEEETMEEYHARFGK